MNKKLTIMVCGLAGTGKTLVAKYIEEFLASKGLEVDRILDDDEAFWDDEMNEAKLADLSEGLEVVVKSIQLRRSLSVKNDTLHDELATWDTMDEDYMEKVIGSK